MQVRDECEIDADLFPVGQSKLSFKDDDGYFVGVADAIVADMAAMARGVSSKGAVDVKITNSTQRTIFKEDGPVREWLRKAQHVLQAFQAPGPHALTERYGELDFWAWVIYMEKSDKVVVLKATAVDILGWDAGPDDEPGPLPSMSWVEPAPDAVEIEAGTRPSGMTRGERLAELKRELIKECARDKNETWTRGGEAMCPLTKDTAAVILGKSVNTYTVKRLMDRLRQESPGVSVIHMDKPWAQCAGVMLRKRGIAASVFVRCSFPGVSLSSSNPEQSSNQIQK